MAIGTRLHHARHRHWQTLHALNRTAGLARRQKTRASVTCPEALQDVQQGLLWPTINGALSPCKVKGVMKTKEREKDERRARGKAK